MAQIIDEDTEVFEREEHTHKEPASSLDIGSSRTCDCVSPTKLNCMTAKEWIKAQLGVWQVNYERRDIRDKEVHPATFPLQLARRVIELFTHKGELVVDPFVGAGTTLLAAQELDRNALGFDLQARYIEVCNSRLGPAPLFEQRSQQLAILDDAHNISRYVAPDSVKLIWTSPPYANMLNRKRKNKSRRTDQRDNGQLDKIEQYSQDERDLGIMSIEAYTYAMGTIFESLLPSLKSKAHCVINVPDFWWEDQRVTIHIALTEEMRRRGYELRNTIIWDRTNIVNKVGIFGWPSNYITMGTTFEYLLDFRAP